MAGAVGVAVALEGGEMRADGGASEFGAEIAGWTGVAGDSSRDSISWPTAAR